MASVTTIGPPTGPKSLMEEGDSPIAAFSSGYGYFLYVDYDSFTKKLE